MYKAYICKITNITNHPNAYRLNIGSCFGNSVVIGKEYNENDLYIYFPVDGQLSEDYATINNLVRKKDEAGNNIGGYLDPTKRNITAIRLRGEKSDGLVMPLSSLEYTGIDTSTLEEGYCFDTINGKLICKKYIPKKPNKVSIPQGNRVRKKKVPIAPLFKEHADTEQLAYNLSAFRPGDQIEITLKMHGTSQRTGYLPVLTGYKRTLLDRILRRDGKPQYDWGDVSGTRRVVLENYEGGFYGDNEFREIHSKKFNRKLWKNETVYYEVVGYQNGSNPIMGTCSNKKLNDKEFIKQYGEETVFSYGCEEGKSEIYVYRMTMTNEDGDVIEYTPDFMRYRCEQIGVNCVPVLWKGYIPEKFPVVIHDDLVINNAGEYIEYLAEQYNDGPDPIGKTHIREGVVVRIINRPRFCAYKSKNFNFKVLEGIIKDTSDAPDIEEAQDIEEVTE